MEDIALLKCNNYKVNNVEKTLREGFELLGGDAFINRLIPHNSHVLLKPNFLAAAEKGSHIITHVSIFEAVIRIIKDYTDKISFGDSPGLGSFSAVAEKSGFMAVAAKYGVKCDDFHETVHVELENPILYKYWEVAKAPYEADVLITLPKLKTHGMMYYTGAVKNQFGCIPGFKKAEWHTKQPRTMDFGKMLLDLNSVVKTSFAILDGIVAMEGNGPRNGTPKQMNSLIMGKSLTAVDSAAVRLIGYDNVLSVPSLKAAYETKWGSVLPEEVNVLGESIEDMKCLDFKPARHDKFFEFNNPSLSKILTNLIAPNPVLNNSKCISCKKCNEVCPEKSKVITFVNRNGKLLPEWNYKNCIRCFCCQELCPQGAIEIKSKPIRKILHLK
ncbi:MAG: DUF362 domain-containing protein [Eubacteriales bacterium]|nr:DUF362 domain-containing protein [Eubacteriales bacterium]